MAEQLKIDIDVAQAKAALDALTASFKAFGVAATAIAGTSSSAIQRLNTEMSKIRGIDGKVLDSLTQLNTAIANLNSGGFSGVSNALGQLGQAAPTVDQAARATTLLNQALRETQVPSGVQQIKVAFGQMGEQAKQADQHVKAFYTNKAKLEKEAAASSRATAKAISELGRELVNAGGFMAGLGVTAGNVLSAFSKITADGRSLKDVIGSMNAEFGKLGTTMAAVAAAAVGFNMLSSVFQAIYTPVLNVGNAFTSFKLAVDAVDGTGAGAPTLERLKGIATATSQDILVLAKNYTGFRAATEAANISAQQSEVIYRQFGGALTALGADTVKSEKAFLALTQMFSKGKVQAEELRGQLGDALPGAFVFAAEAMGVTTGALDKMLKSGQVLAQDLVPALGKFLEVKFGDAISKQAEMARGQMTQFASALNNVFAAIGDGGALSGLAYGLSRVNATLNSPGVLALADAFGKLLGLIVNLGLSALSGFAAGLTSVINVVATLWNEITKLFGFEDVISLFEQGSATMKVLSTVFYSVGAAIGVLSIGFAVKMVAGIGGYIAAAVKAIATTTALTGAFGRLTAVMLANPFMRIASLVLAVGTAAYAAYQQYAPLNQELATTETSSQKAEKALSGTTQALEKFIERARETPASVAEMATGFESLETAQERTKTKIDELKEALKAQDATMRDSQETSEDIRRRQEEFASGIQQEIQALEAKKNALNANAADMKEYGIELDGNKGRVRDISEQITNLRETLQSSAIATGDALRREAEWRDSMGDNKEQIQQQIEALEMWGVALSASGVATAEQAKALGFTKDEAAALAYEVQMLTRTEAERAQALAAEAEQNQKKIDFLTRQIELVKQARDAEVDRLKKNGESADTIEKMTQAYNKQLTSMGDLRTTTSLLTVAQLAYQRSLTENIPITQAVEEEARKMEERTGKSVDRAKALGDATELMAGKVKGSGDSMAEAGGKAEDLAEKTGETADKLGSVTEKTEKAKTALETISGTLTTVITQFSSSNEALTTTADAFDKMAGASNSLTNSLPISTPLIQQLVATIGAGLEVLGQFTTKFGELTVAMDKLVVSVPTVIPQFLSFFALLPSAAEPMNMFVNSLGRIPGMAEGINVAQTAMQNLVEKTVELIPQMGQAAEAFNNLRKAQDSIVVGFENGMKAADQFMSKLDDVMAKAGDAIRRMNELREAAEAALKAANEAAAAQSQTTTGGGRYGGYATSLPESQTVNSSVFNNAPQFRDGTANTSQHLSKVPGGGIPSILHPNEAVVPLPKGRSIPVDLNLSGLPSPAPVMPDINLAPLNDLAHTLGRLDRTLEAAVQAYSAPVMEAPVQDMPVVVPPKAAYYQSPNGLDTSNLNSPNETGVSRQNSEVRQSPINVTVNVTASDLDSFRRSEDQIARSLSDKISRAKRRTSR